MRLFLAVAAALLPQGPALAANVEECAAVAETSLVGFFDFDTVTIAADPLGRICRFSVNGATAGSPPQEDVSAAYDSLLGEGGGRAGSLGSGEMDIDALATLMLAAGPDKTTWALRQALSELETELDTCLGSGLAGDAARLTVENRFYCGVTWGDDGGTDSRFGPFQAVFQARPEVPRLRIILEREGRWTLLSMPIAPQ